MSDDRTQEIRDEDPEEATAAVPDEPTVELPATDAVAAPDEPTTRTLPSVGSPEPKVTPPAAPLGTQPADTGHIRVTSAPPAPAATPAPEQQSRPSLRVGTVVWGLVIAAIGVGLLSIAWGANLDAQLALIVLLGAAGVALLVGSLVGMRRSRHRMEGRG